MKKVTKEEFDKFIDAYPGKLEVDVSGISEPPTKTWNDFALGNWPESVVAACSVFNDDSYYTDAIKGYVKVGDSLQANWRIKEIK